jgi:hypothetical protein
MLTKGEGRRPPSGIESLATAGDQADVLGRIMDPFDTREVRRRPKRVAEKLSRN